MNRRSTMFERLGIAYFAAVFAFLLACCFVPSVFYWTGGQIERHVEELPAAILLLLLLSWPAAWRVKSPPPFN